MYNIQFCIPMKLVRLIKLCLNETYSRVRVGQLLSDMFCTKNGMKKEDVLSPLLFSRDLEYVIKKVKTIKEGLRFNGIY